MYKQIYIPVDNSDFSNAAIEIGVLLAKQFGSQVVGSHAYAAKLHDRRFKQMEAGLPEEYHDERELDRQRKIHDSLITRGLELITDSYLDIIDKKCKESNIPVERRSLEGKNFKVLVEDVVQNGYDLVIMGVLGVGAVKDSLIGSVCERMVRRVRTADFFVTKSLETVNGGKIVVGVDGSPQSFGGLKTALGLGKALGKEVDVVSAFDPYYHYAVFNSISGVLSEEAGKVFRFKEQEKLHEEVIDSGLAKIYQSHLEISRKVAEAEGMEIKTALLDGKPFEKVLQYVKREKPWLLVVGRIGIHSDEEMDIGSNSENLLRMAPCHVLISNRVYVPPIDAVAEYTVAWTDEAKKRMERVPSFARRLAMTAVYRYALEKGHTIISNSVVDAALGEIMPKRAMEAVKELGQMAVKAETTKKEEGDPASRWLCDGCGYTARGERPVRCPICGVEGEKFQYLDMGAIEKAASSEGTVEKEMTFDEVPLQWTEEAKNVIRTAPAGIMRRQAKLRIEKLARKRGLSTITREFAAPLVEEYLGGKVDMEQIKEAKRIGMEWSGGALRELETVSASLRETVRAMVEKKAQAEGVAVILPDTAMRLIPEAKKEIEEAAADPVRLAELLRGLRSSKE